jgi:hypothetical protein
MTDSNTERPTVRFTKNVKKSSAKRDMRCLRLTFTADTIDEEKFLIDLLRSVPRSIQWSWDDGRT